MAYLADEARPTRLRNTEKRDRSESEFVLYDHDGIGGREMVEASSLNALKEQRMESKWDDWLYEDEGYYY